MLEEGFHPAPRTWQLARIGLTRKLARTATTARKRSTAAKKSTVPIVFRKQKHSQHGREQSRQGRVNVVLSLSHPLYLLRVDAKTGNSQEDCSSSQRLRNLTMTRLFWKATAETTTRKRSTAVKKSP